MDRRQVLRYAGAGVVFTSMSAVAAGASTALRRSGTVGTETPVIAFSEHPTRPSPARRPVLRFMAWSDGLLYDDNAALGSASAARLRMADAEWVARLHDSLRNIEHLPQRAFRVPDHSYMMLTTRGPFSGRCQLSWDEVIRPRWGANPEASEGYHQFVHAWYSIRLALAAGVFEELTHDDSRLPRELSALRQSESFSQWLNQAFPE